MIRLENGKIHDPFQSDSGATKTLWIDGDRIVTEPSHALHPAESFDCRDCVIMAGGIDAHTHIGGGKVNIARLMLPSASQRETEMLETLNQAGTATRPIVPSTIQTGRMYLELGYTACFEPAVIPCGAKHAHCELGDTPFLDTGAYLMLGNESTLLEMIHRRVGNDMIRDYVAWMLMAHRCLAVKVVNPAGVHAFQDGTFLSTMDDPDPRYGVTGRQVLFQLAQAVDQLGIPHPIHVHCANLGVPGNIETTLQTIDAVEGHRIHLTHSQFHCYSNQGPHGISSAAERLADAINNRPEISTDVGQVLFGQTVTLSGDLAHQWHNRTHARPRKTFFQNLESQGGCGVVPFRYREGQYVHSLQWSIGLELFLRIKNPWQVFLTTDHPNGAPFTSYPHLIRLLMDYRFRMECFSKLHPDVQATSPLPTLKREYTLDEIAIMTRSGPARSLGLDDVGRLVPGSIADLCVYRQHENPEQMFSKPWLVIKQGQVVFQQGHYLRTGLRRSYQLDVEYDRQILQQLRRNWETRYQQTLHASSISSGEWERISQATPVPIRSREVLS
ncbi:MAG: formylmethanofuran dehydrogenase subunit A [Pirellulales bacterium]